MTTEQIDTTLAKLRVQFPNTPEYVWQERREFLVLEAKLQNMRVRLAELAGYHHHDGAIPVRRSSN